MLRISSRNHHHARGFYLGPLPPRCPRSHHAKPLTGRAQGQWHTVTAQDWPLDLCSYVSHSVLSPVLRTGGAAGRNAPIKVPPKASPSSGSQAAGSSSSGSSAPLPPCSGYPAALNTSSTPDVGAGCPDSSEAHLHAAEKFACELLAGGSTLQAKDLERLYDLLPKETSPRDPGGRTPSSFSSGAYNKGGITGLRKAIQDFPKATRCLTHFVRTVRPQHVFSTVSLYDNVCTSLHRDGRNSPIDNLVLPLTKFSGGEVWLKDEKGTVPQSLDDCEVMGTALGVWHKHRGDARPASAETAPCFKSSTVTRSFSNAASHFQVL